MAEDSDLEKTESATPRRLQKAREEGQIVRSRELSTFALLAAGFFGVWGMSGSIGEHLQSMLRAAFTFDHAGAFETRRMMIGAGVPSREGFYALLPILALHRRGRLARADGAGRLAVVGERPRTEVQPPQSDRPASARCFRSTDRSSSACRSLKTLVVGVIGGTAIWNRREEMLALATQPLQSRARQHRASDRRVLRHDGGGHVRRRRARRAVPDSGSSTRSCA